MKFRTRIQGLFVLLLFSTGSKISLAQSTLIQLPLNDLSEFQGEPSGWSVAGKVWADISQANSLNIEKGQGILANLPSKSGGQDIYTKQEFGDIDLELEYMMAPGSNSGIYLQGRYEIQLADSWGTIKPSFGSNGGIYERWWETQPQGIKGFEGVAPRQNVSRAPGTWQKIKISFQAPRFDNQDRKIANAVIRRVELNGVLIHDNVELSGPTRGAVYESETRRSALRFQGDHGAVAFRNIRITNFEQFRPEETKTANTNETDPIYIEAKEDIVMRSFIDLPGKYRVVHAVSVGSPENVHYTYDMDHGTIVQVWRGHFLDATPMWHDRGDGSSRPRGTVQRFGKPSPDLAVLSSLNDSWPSDTAGSSFRQKGYVLDNNGRPAFKYYLGTAEVTDKSVVLPEGKGIKRTVTVSKSPVDLYYKIASGSSIEELPNGIYSIDGNAYLIQLDRTSSQKPILRTSLGRSELLIKGSDIITYSILF